MKSTETVRPGSQWLPRLVLVMVGVVLGWLVFRGYGETRRHPQQIQHRNLILWLIFSSLATQSSQYGLNHHGQLDKKGIEPKAREQKYEHDRRDLTEHQSRLDLREQIQSANEEGTLKRLKNLLAASETSKNATHAARSQKLDDKERELRVGEDDTKEQGRRLKDLDETMKTFQTNAEACGKQLNTKYTKPHRNQ